MKVISKDKNGDLAFRNIGIGEVFAINGNIFMKIVISGQCNAVELRTGATHVIGDSSLVSVVKGSFVEE